MSTTVPSEQSPSFQSEGDINLSPQRAAWQARNIGESARQLLAEDARYFLRQSLSTPCLNVMQSCGGAWIEDIEGRRYLDFHGNAVHQVGFGNAHVIEAIKRQLDILPFCTRRYTNSPAIALARRLTELAPGDLNKVLFAPGGTSAIGMAMKLARIVTGRFKTVSLWESFHGASLDAISVGGEALFRKGVGPLLPGTEHVPPPDPMEGPWPDLAPDEWAMKSAEYLEYVLEREAGDIGAVVAETIRWTPFVPPLAYWKKIREACDRHGALLILDEVPACLGRTGKMFACEHYGIVPDMLVIGKGLGGGVFPLAALLAREGLDRYEAGALGHYTHEKNPVAAAARLATLDIIAEEGFLMRVRQLGEQMLVELRGLQNCHTIIAEVRGIGLMLGVVLKLPDGSKAVDAAEWMMYRALDKGLSFKITMGCILTLTPALTIEEDDLALALTILDECFQEMPTELTLSKS